MHQNQLLQCLVATVLAISLTPPLAGQYDHQPPLRAITSGSVQAVLSTPRELETRLAGEEHPALMRLVSLQLRHVPLGEALQAIGEKSGLSVAFSVDAIPVDRVVSLNAVRRPARDLFRQVLAGVEAEFGVSPAGQVVIFPRATEREDVRLRSAAGLSLPALAHTEVTDRRTTQGSIVGRVTNAATGEAVAGANILVVGSRFGAVSGNDGRYAMTGVPEGNHQVQANHLGYRPETRSVTVATGQAAALDFELTQEAIALEGVVAVGYGTQRARDVTGSISSMRAEDLEKAQASTVTQALQGRIAGVQVTQASSQPGGGVSIRIRGGGSLGTTNEPLYVVDGMPISGGDNNDPTGGGKRVSTNPLGFLNPDDIESIEVLKDASSTAIYGARGTNGVVLITTKQGRPGISRMEFESSFAQQRVARKIPLLNAQEFVEYANEWARLRGEPLPAFEEDAASFGEGTDWQDLIFQTAPMQEHQVSMLGGSEATRFSISANYADQEGVVRRTGFERYSLRANVSHRPRSWLNLGTNVNFSRMNSSIGFSSGGHSYSNPSVVNAALLSLPVLGIFDENGEYTVTDKNMPIGIARTGLVGGAGDNAIALMEETHDQAKYDRMLGNVFTELDLADGLLLRLNGAADLGNNSRDEYYTRRTRRGGLGLNGMAHSGVIEQSRYLGESILNYKTSIGGLHDLDLTTGFMLEREEKLRRNQSNRNFPNDLTRYYNIGAGTPEGGPSVSSSFEDWTLASYLGRANYSLAGRYLFTVTGRADGSSKFGAQNKWGFFPSGAFAWRVSDEKFLSNIDAISDLKLRVSYGITGNQEIGTYRSLSRIDDINYNFAGTIVSGYRTISIANPELRWEKSRQLDLGFDMALFENRVGLVFDVYRKLTEDLLMDVPLPAETGFNSALMNIGSVENKGVELAVNAELLSGDGGKPGWRTGFNIGHNRSRVVDLGESTEMFGSRLSGDMNLPGLLAREGEPMGVFYGYRIDGLFRDQAEVDAYVGAEGNPIMPGAVPGQMRFADVNGDGRITEDDRTILGNPEPDFTFGWTNDLSYGPVSLYAFLQGTYGNEVYNINMEQLGHSTHAPGINMYKPRWTNRWTPENPDGQWPVIGLRPGVGYNGPGNDAHLYIEDGSYLRLRSLTLSYDLPERLASSFAGMETARLFLSGENLFTLTGYNGYSPDVNTEGQNNLNRGIDLSSYPTARVFRVGFRFGL